MDFTSFSSVLAWIIAHGYPLMFVAMLVEGPIVTAAASFASALGYFNLGIVFVLAILGDLLADVLYYALGYWGRASVVHRVARFFGLTEKRIKHMEYLVHTHSGKTLMAIKLTPGIALPGLAIVGYARMPFKKFLQICLFIILPKVLLFTVLGYYFGRAYEQIGKYLENGITFIGVGLVVVALVYWLYDKVSARIARKTEKL